MTTSAVPTDSWLSPPPTAITRLTAAVSRMLACTARLVGSIDQICGYIPNSSTEPTGVRARVAITSGMATQT